MTYSEQRWAAGQHVIDLPTSFWLVEDPTIEFNVYQFLKELFAWQICCRRVRIFTGWRETFCLKCASESAGHGSASHGEARGDVPELRRGRAPSHPHRVQVSGRDGFRCQSRRRSKGASGWKEMEGCCWNGSPHDLLLRLPARTRPSWWSPSSPALSRRATSPSRTSARTWAGRARTEPSATRPKESETETAVRARGPTPNTPWADPRTNCGSLAKNQRYVFIFLFLLLYVEMIISVYDALCFWTRTKSKLK